MPKLPAELPDGEPLGDRNGGSCFYGTKGILVVGTYSRNPRLLPLEMNELFKVPDPTIPRLNKENAHALSFVDGCLEGKKTSSPIPEYAGPLTEAVLMGNLAIRAFQFKELQEDKTETSWAPWNYPGRRTLYWDGEKMKVTNYDRANEWVSRGYREGWDLS